jgi:hypothetical protein
MSTHDLLEKCCFSSDHKTYINAIINEVFNCYGQNLAGFAVFGSYARFENRKNSDLDLLIILNEAPRRTERVSDFTNQIEMKYEHVAQSIYEQEEILCDLSPYILTVEEASTFHPIYSDLIEHCMILHDPKNLIKHIIASTKTLLRVNGAQKIRRNNSWEWQLKRYLGGVKLYEKR